MVNRSYEIPNYELHLLVYIPKPNYNQDIGNDRNFQGYFKWSDFDRKFHFNFIKTLLS